MPSPYCCCEENFVVEKVKFNFFWKYTFISMLTFEILLYFTSENYFVSAIFAEIYYSGIQIKSN